jgi:hypothetical protein
MMCACEENFARRFLPHQISKGTELVTQHPVLVTLGFQERICNTCRGLPEEPYPKAESYGKTSKIERYYWREIYFETTRRFAEWADMHNYTDYRMAHKDNHPIYDAIRKDVVDYFKKLHGHTPKYAYQEKSQEEIISEFKVEVVRLDGVYVEHTEREARIASGNNTYSAEGFVAHHYEQQGYETLYLESRPFHAMFAIFMWMLIQDPADPLVRIVGIGDRTAFDEGRKGAVIWLHLPQDFGTAGYATRRVEAINKHFALIPNERDELLWTFNYWVEPSADLRQYLGVHNQKDVERARKLVSLLPVDVIHRILRYLIANYWKRYIGWPDLLIYKPNDYFLAEVKSSKDKLRENQKNWIQGNSSDLHLPFRIVKIHKKRGLTP